MLESGLYPKRSTAGAGLLILPPVLEHTEDSRLQAPEFAFGSRLADIQRSNQLRVGVVSGMPGFCDRDEDGRFGGLDIEISKRLARSVFGGSRQAAVDAIEFVDIALHDREVALEEDQVDFVISVFAITAERRKRVDFSLPYFGTALSALMRREHANDDVTQLQNARIGVAAGTVGESFTTKNGIGANVVEYESIAEIVDAVHDGDVDACVTSSFVLDNYARRDPDNLVKMPWSLTQLSHGIGVQKGNDELRAYLDAEIQTMWSEGTLMRLANCFETKARTTL